MSSEHRFDPLGLAELDSILPDAAHADGRRDGSIASRRAFVEMKQLFLQAVEDLSHRKAAWLRAQVRAAEDPVDLWLLRNPLLAALREDDHATRAMRAALYRSLDLAFPDGFGLSRAPAANGIRVAN